MMALIYDISSPVALSLSLFRRRTDDSPFRVVPIYWDEQNY